MKGGKQKNNGHPEIWAVLTILTFPIVLVATDVLDFEGMWPFMIALTATFVVILFEALVRGKLWIFEKGFVDHISHPELPARIIIFVGATLLILETALIFSVATNRQFDRTMLGLVMRKSCSAKYDKTSVALCNFLQAPADSNGERVQQKFDQISFVTREAAAKAWFPNESFVTCADQKIKLSTISQETCANSSVMHCSSWKVDGNGVLRVKKSITQFTRTSLTKDESGSYKVSSFEDDATSEELRQISYQISPELITILHAEAFSRAQSFLK
jgi:hypothetical protein